MIKSELKFYKVLNMYYWRVIFNDKQIAHSNQSFKSEQLARENWELLQSLKDL